MPKLTLQTQQQTVLFSGGEEVSESDLALRQLAEGGGGARTQSRPPVMWTWAAILTIGAVIIAVVFWLVTLAPAQFLPDTSREVPELVNMERSEAMAELSKLDLIGLPIEQTNEEVASGHVISTDPEPGSVLDVGDKITLYISTGPETAEVPDFTRMSEEEYTQAIEDLGLAVSLVSTVDNPVEPAGRVLEVKPEVGTELESGDGIEITVSSGKVDVPDVMHSPQEVARSQLADLGLEISFIASSTEETGCVVQPGYPVIAQSIVGSQPQGSTIELSYCAG